MFAVLPAADEITQGFGCVALQEEWYAPWCPLKRYHSGVDLGHTLGGSHIFKAPVFATWAGEVVRIGDPVGLGDQAVCLALDGGGWLWFGHLEAALVLLGEHVRVGQEVGLLGSRGLSQAPHLHLEYRIDSPTRNVDHQAAGLRTPVAFLQGAPRMTEDQLITLGHLMSLLAYQRPMNPQQQQDLVNTWKAGRLNLSDTFAGWYAAGQAQGTAYPRPAGLPGPFLAQITPR